MDLFDQPTFQAAFYGPDDLIWLIVRDVTNDTGNGLGVIKLDFQDNVVDSFTLNMMVGAGSIGPI